MATIRVLKQDSAVQNQGDIDFICLTDIARYEDAKPTDDLIRNWLRNRNTREFPGLWGQLNNPNFNPFEFNGIKIQGTNSEEVEPDRDSPGESRHR